MIYQEEVAVLAARKWKVPTSTLTRWKRTGIIPDCRLFNDPLDKAGLLAESKLLLLVESGWLKGASVSRLIRCKGDKVNAVLSARRHPNDSRYHVKHLDGGKEIEAVKKLLAGLTREVGTVLYLASVTPADRPYGDVVQAGLRGLLAREYVSTVNIRAGMDSRQVGRFWAFMRGQPAKRADLDEVVGKLKLLIALLT